MPNAQVSDQPSIDISPRPLGGSPQWPGERDPTRWDVHDANQSLATTFLERFKTVLLHSEEAQACRSLIPPLAQDVLQAPAVGGNTSDLQAGTNSVRNYTYPMVLLADLPPIPEEAELARLQSLFFTSFKLHIYLDAVHIPDTAQSLNPPYFPLTLACLASAVLPRSSSNGYLLGTDNSQGEVSASLFAAGLGLWCVVLEVDNREARLLEAVVAASLLFTYGILSGDRGKWKKAASLLSNTATIVRRLRLSDGYSPFYTPAPSDRNHTMQSSLMSYIFLTDIIHAIHCGTPPTYSTTELNIKMPSSNHQFRTIYALLHGQGPLPKDVRSREDGLLLLTALLCDTIYIQRCYLPLTPTDSARPVPQDDLPLCNPYAPLSSQSEHFRLDASLHAALGRWKQHFQPHVGKDILALYQFCELQLACPNIWELPHLAGYMATAPTTELIRMRAEGHQHQPSISDEAMNLAWLVLDNCNMETESSQRKMAIWFPVVLFASALVIWQRLRFRSPTDKKYGTLKMLGMFKSEIAQLPWDCCVEMESTLNRLMKE